MINPELYIVLLICLQASDFTMKIPFILVLIIVPLIKAQVPHWGPCPEPAVQPGFILKQVKTNKYNPFLRTVKMLYVLASSNRV